MAKTFKELWPQVVSWENLVRAYQKCRRGKRYESLAAQFDFDWESQLLRLQKELISNAYRPGAYRNFYIYEPKRRKISAAPFRDRVVHHAIVRVLEPIYERRFIYDSYACRIGKGTHAAIDRAQTFLRNYGYYLKTDIVKFFPNVDHEVMRQTICKTIADSALKRLIDLVLVSGEGVLDDEATNEYFPGDDLLAILRPKGLPIGNLTSQFFANVLLDQVDHFAKETLRVPGYVRYADDMILFSNSKEELWRFRERLAEFLALQRLCIHPKKTYVRCSSLGVAFLGLKLSRSGRRLPQSNIRRFSSRLRRMRWLWSNGQIEPKKIGESLVGWTNYADGTNSIGIRKAIWKRVRFKKR